MNNAGRSYSIRWAFLSTETGRREGKARDGASPPLQPPARRYDVTPVKARYNRPHLSRWRIATSTMELFPEFFTFASAATQAHRGRSVVGWPDWRRRAAARRAAGLTSGDYARRAGRLRPPTPPPAAAGRAPSADDRDGWPGRRHRPATPCGPPRRQRATEVLKVWVFMDGFRLSETVVCPRRRVRS